MKFLKKWRKKKQKQKCLQKFWKTLECFDFIFFFPIKSLLYYYSYKILNRIRMRMRMRVS